MRAACCVQVKRVSVVRKQVQCVRTEMKHDWASEVKVRLG